MSWAEGHPKGESQGNRKDRTVPRTSSARLLLFPTYKWGSGDTKPSCVYHGSIPLWSWKCFALQWPLHVKEGRHSKWTLVWGTQWDRRSWGWKDMKQCSGEQEAEVGDGGRGVLLCDFSCSHTVYVEPRFGWGGVGLLLKILEKEVTVVAWSACKCLGLSKKMMWWCKQKKNCINYKSSEVIKIPPIN